MGADQVATWARAQVKRAEGPAARVQRHQDLIGDSGGRQRGRAGAGLVVVRSVQACSPSSVHDYCYGGTEDPCAGRTSASEGPVCREILLEGLSPDNLLRSGRMAERKNQLTGLYTDALSRLCVRNR